MLQMVSVFSGFSVHDIEAVKDFYASKLGMNVEDSMGGVSLTLPSGGKVYVYAKPNHEPATYTVLNIVVSDIDAAVDELIAEGVTIERYDGMHQDDKGISRGKAANMGPDIAWFKDPAGNILSVLQN